MEIDGPADEDGLQSIKELNMTFRYLENLALKGSSQRILELASAWKMPRLRRVSIDYPGKQDELPDIGEFLLEHGSDLIHLSLSCPLVLDTTSISIADILGHCPLLETFAFDADRRCTPSEYANTQAKLVNTPHHSIQHIGLNGLSQAFLPDDNNLNPVISSISQRINDFNFAAINKGNFPHLKSVRVLSRPLLSALEKRDGPDPSCLVRWERWWNQCARSGVRLEGVLMRSKLRIENCYDYITDCTGALLGTLPPKSFESEIFEEEESDDEEGSYEEGSFQGSEEEEEEEEGEDANIHGRQYPLGQVPGFQYTGASLGGTMVEELRQLLEECQNMSKDRVDGPFSMGPGMFGLGS